MIVLIEPFWLFLTSRVVEYFWPSVCRRTWQPVSNSIKWFYLSRWWHGNVIRSCSTHVQYQMWAVWGLLAFWLSLSWTKPEYMSYCQRWTVASITEKNYSTPTHPSVVASHFMSTNTTWGRRKDTGLVETGLNHWHASSKETTKEIEEASKIVLKTVQSLLKIRLITWDHHLWEKKWGWNNILTDRDQWSLKRMVKIKL